MSNDSISQEETTTTTFSDTNNANIVNNIVQENENVSFVEMIVGVKRLQINDTSKLVKIDNRQLINQMGNLQLNDNT